jgi:hypothetical protein
MATDKQIKANKMNARLGGVKTDEGKEISRMNALKHGFFSQIVTQFEKIEHKDFCKEIYSVFSPANIYESQIVEILLSNILAYRRICLLESQLVKNELQKTIENTESLNVDFDDTDYQKHFRKYVMDEMLKINRYKICAFNMTTKAQHELERLVRIRSGESIPSPSVCDINITDK